MRISTLLPVFGFLSAGALGRKMEDGWIGSSFPAGDKFCQDQNARNEKTWLTGVNCHEYDVTNQDGFIGETSNKPLLL